jgi:hypothetical protein
MSTVARDAATTAIGGDVDQTPTPAAVAMPLCDGTAYYNAVKNRWFGLGNALNGR